ncbi:hypothetical protein BV898_11216 [Hypsibius exemplaris]|uniref:Gustatory receptor n=1 Tax=Hypsibius exemplaris TaxID=2072580 RepID=A0A1W0WHD3_HYPEX|nr:hypothetical protein BV898_11216 [Hypsibius exemplaris]
METKHFTPPLYSSYANTKSPETTREMRLRHEFKQSVNQELYHANPLNEEEYRNICDLFRPVLWLMALQGLFHPSHRATTSAIPVEHRYSPLSRWIMMALSLCNVCYMFANFVLLLAARPNVQLTSFYTNTYVILLVWLATAVILAALQFLICERSTRYDRIWEKWAYWARHPRKRNWKRMRVIRNIYILLAVAIAVTPTVIVAVIMSRNRPGSGLEELLTLVTHGDRVVSHNWWTINFCIVAFSVFGTLSFTSVFFVTHCLVLADELRDLFHRISDQLDSGRIWDVVKEEKEEVSVLEQLRRRRLECRDIVGAVDGAFEETAFFFIFANVPLIVFISYGLVSYGTQSEFRKAMGVIALLGSLLQVLVVTIVAAWVHEWIHNYLKVTRVNALSMELFLSELTSESVGITAWAFAVITKEFIATVVGLAVSYIIVLVEFRHLAGCFT